MKQDILDSMKEKLLEKHNNLKDILVTQIKIEAPKKKTSPVLRDWAVDHLGFQDIEKLIGEFGREAVNRILYEKYISQFDRRRK